MRTHTPSSDAFALLLIFFPTIYAAFPNAPNNYTPGRGDCPSTRPSVRSAGSLSRNETSWLEKRRNTTVEYMGDLLRRCNITDFDAEQYIAQHQTNASALPNIAIAASGGGYRALLNVGGAIQAFDSREINSTASGHLGGLLQSATYLAGLSGGGWLVGSLYVNNFTTITDLRNGNVSSTWQFDNSIFEGPATGRIQIFDTAQYFDNIYKEVGSKKDGGFETSVTDYWGRALSYQLINATGGGPAYTWSSIQLQDSFANGASPMPVLVADGRAPDEKLIPSNTTIYEFNPYEFGTWDPTTFGFVPLEYLGSNFTAGSLPEGAGCVRGFDNAGFIMGTSSSLFNQFLLNANQTDLPDVAKIFINKVLGTISNENNDIADYTPNPFYHYRNDTSTNAQSQRLTLVDGGEDLQNIPLHPLIQPDRKVDVIFAIDSSADTENYWPNGTSLVATYERSLNTSAGNIANGTSFPSVPDVNTFVNLGLNQKPTFFGCNSSNTSTITPLIIYIPNTPYVYHSNVSTFDPTYNITERNAILQNGYEVATMGNGTVDPQWPTCVGCAILSRSLERTETTVPDVCRQCFQRYCWNGATNSTTPPPYNPAYKSRQVLAVKSAAAERIGGMLWSLVFVSLSALWAVS
ncbi:MAG: hypothetical protein Q9217_001983 [Psora testacea]